MTGQSWFSYASLGSARVQSELRPLGSERDRVDIVIDTAELLIFIEVKIDAAEGVAQLSRYAKAAKRAAAAQAASTGEMPKRTLTLFLSPRAPVEAVAGVVHITWRDVSRALLAASGRAEGISCILLRSFAAHVRSFG